MGDSHRLSCCRVPRINLSLSKTLLSELLSRGIKIYHHLGSLVAKGEKTVRCIAVEPARCRLPSPGVETVQDYFLQDFS